MKISFASILQDMLRDKGISITSQEPLTHLDYNEEIKIKNDALKTYWKTNQILGTPNDITPSLKGRYYRTTSKRKVVEINGKYYFLFNPQTKPKNGLFNKSLLEPVEHTKIYEVLIHKINEPAYKIVGKSLNYIIIRGSYTEFSVIFNAHTLNGDIVRKIKLLGDQLKSIGINIISVFIYLDPTRSDYYLENERPNVSVTFKKLYGPDHLFLKLKSVKYSYHPTSFSQVNESMIPVLLTEAKKMLKPEKDQTFFDLYCGYGLFTLHFADEVSAAMGIEIEGESIRSAITNASFQRAGKKIRFTAANITGDNLKHILPPPSQNEIFLLDPPRQGTESKVIGVIAERLPLRILNIFCGIEEIQRETDEWLKHGYTVKEIQPLDMFPGTTGLEILILLEAK